MYIIVSDSIYTDNYRGGKKLQYALGTIPGVSEPEEPLATEDLLKLNDKTLDSTMMNQFFLKEKMISTL